MIHSISKAPTFISPHSIRTSSALTLLTLLRTFFGGDIHPDLWFAAMISFSSSLCLADFPCGRGVAVTRAVQRGEVLLTVPLAQCWTAASARRRLEVPVEMTEKEAIIAELMVLKDGVGWMFAMSHFDIVLGSCSFR